MNVVKEILVGEMFLTGVWVGNFETTLYVN